MPSKTSKSLPNTEPTSPQYWVLVGSLENFEITRNLNFSVAGIKSTRRKKAEAMAVGDFIVYYLTGLMAIAGIVKITSPCYEAFEPIWGCSSDKRPEIFPYRVKTEPVLIAGSQEQFLPVAPLHPQLEYLKKWPEKNWTLGFQGQLHLWPESDYRLVYDALATKIQVSQTQS
jgi:predicted RNA-binding protein